MFDRYYRTQAPNYPQRVTITENRAPTDESVKLLREMQEAAEKNRVEAFNLKSNDFEGRVEIFEEPFHVMRASARFKINGKLLSASAISDNYTHEWRISLLLKLRDAIAEKVANEILGDMVKGANHD